MSGSVLLSINQSILDQLLQFSETKALTRTVTQFIYRHVLLKTRDVDIRKHVMWKNT